MDRSSEQQQLLRRDSEWAALSSDGRDVDRIVSYWTDDATVFPPGMPVVSGKAALRQYVEGAIAIPGFHITWKSSAATVSADGRFGYLVSENAVTLPGPDGKPITTPGRAITVWRKEPDGEWRCVADIWNDAPPTAG